MSSKTRHKIKERQIKKRSREKAKIVRVPLTKTGRTLSASKSVNSLQQQKKRAQHREVTTAENRIQNLWKQDL